MLCKTPSAHFNGFFYGKTSDTTVRLGPERDVLRQSFTYDMACHAPCAVAQDCAATLHVREPCSSFCSLNMFRVVQVDCGSSMVCLMLPVTWSSGI